VTGGGVSSVIYSVIAVLSGFITTGTKRPTTTIMFNCPAQGIFKSETTNDNIAAITRIGYHKTTSDLRKSRWALFEFTQNPDRKILGYSTGEDNVDEYHIFP
jgi:hypothetical protein